MNSPESKKSNEGKIGVFICCCDTNVGGVVTTAMNKTIEDLRGLGSFGSVPV